MCLPIRLRNKHISGTVGMLTKCTLVLQITIEMPIRLRSKCISGFQMTFSMNLLANPTQKQMHLGYSLNADEMHFLVF